MSNFQIVDLTTICHSFPEDVDKPIYRDNIVDAMEDLLSGGSQAVVVEGVEGIGKTTLLTQFARRHPSHTFSLFVSATSRLAYDPQSVHFDLCNQLNWALHGEELSTTDQATDSLHRILLMTLVKKAKRQRAIYYFVIDGLHDIPETGTQTQETILDMLPLGLPNMRFLFSGNYEQLVGQLSASVRLRPHVLPRFTLEETVEYFSDVITEQHAVEEVYKSFQKTPQYLASVRRTLKSGVSVAEFLDNMALQVPDPFQLEWRRLSPSDELDTTILALITFSEIVLTVAELAQIAKSTVVDVKVRLQRATFIVIDPHSSAVSYVSQAFRKFAFGKLEHLRKQAIDMLVDHMLENPDSAASLTTLAEQLKVAGRLQELLEYLSPEHFARILESTQSFSEMRRKADLGVAAAVELHREADLVRFVLQRSTIAELEGVDIWRSEIEAYIALKNYSAAISLAQAAVAKEDRLQLLAIIANAQAKHRDVLSVDVVEQIRQLYNQIDVSVLGSERAIEIATDLVNVDTTLAIELVERATDRRGDENALDWAFAKLSIAALISNRNVESRPFLDTFESLKMKIMDPQARRLSSAMSLLVGEYSSQRVIEEVERLESTSDRLFLLRLWALEHRKHPDAIEVVEYAIRLILKTTPYVPSARDFRELATPLPYVVDQARLRKVIGSLDSQQAAIEGVGPTEEYTRLRLLLAQAEMAYDDKAARNRVIDIYLDLGSLGDVAVRAQCMARLAAALAQIDPDNALEAKDKLHSMVDADLNADIVTLLTMTGEQFHITRGTIKALAKAKPEMALGVANRLNVEFRRNAAILVLIGAAIRVPIDNLDLQFVMSAINCITEPSAIDDAVLTVLGRIDEQSPAPTDVLIQEAMPLIDLLQNIGDAGRRCQGYSTASVLLSRCGSVKYSGLRDSILDRLRVSWHSIDVGWHKIDVGFRIAQTLAISAPEVARAYVSEAEALRGETALDAEGTAQAYLSNLTLAIKGYSALLPKGIDTPGDLERISRLIERVPSYGERAGLWTFVALYHFLEKRSDTARQIVSDNLKPLIEQLQFSDIEYSSSVIVGASPALYLAHKTTAFDIIGRLPLYKRSQAYYEIATFIFRKIPSIEPYNVLAIDGYDITYEEIVDLCELMPYLEFDYYVYDVIDSITDSLIGRSKDRFTRNQKADIAGRLGSIVDSNLPDRKKRSIQHDGYKIAARARIARITQTSAEFWAELLEEARNVPNISDVSFVLAIIAASMPATGKNADKRRAVLDEILACIPKIPSTFDQIDRYHGIASIILGTDLAIAKKCIELGMKASQQENDPTLYQRQCRFIDIAHSIDSDFAASFASWTDTDPAREPMRKMLKAHLQTVRLKSEIADKEINEGSKSLARKADLPGVADMLLGALNAGKLGTYTIEYMRMFVGAAADLPLSKAYPVLNWLITNAKMRFSRTNQARTYLRPIFEATILGAELAERIAARSQAKLKRIRGYALVSASASDTEIRAGERGIALQLLADWFENDVRDFLKICDEYFGPADLEILQLLQSVNPECRVEILTSRKHQQQENVSIPWEDAFRSHWRLHISPVQSPPDTEVVIVGTVTTNKSPIHDRWWLTKGSGLRIGTSFASLGVAQESEISRMSTDSSQSKLDEVDKYLVYRQREDSAGEKLVYTLFTL